MHSVGDVMPPTHACVAEQVSASSAQLISLPHASTAMPHSHPRAVQVVASHSGAGGASHWKGCSMPQYSPLAQPPLPSIEQLISFSAAVPQPSNTTPHSRPSQATVGSRGTQSSPLGGRGRGPHWKGDVTQIGRASWREGRGDAVGGCAVETER